MPPLWYRSRDASISTTCSPPLSRGKVTNTHTESVNRKLGASVPKIYNHYSVFISSPRDVKDERAVCHETIQRVSNGVSDLQRLTLVPNAWERHLPETPQIGTKSIQDTLNDGVMFSDIFILILGARYGSIERNHTKSNTEREVDAILERKARDPRKTILCYLKKLAPNDDMGPQERANRKFRERLRAVGVMWKEYTDHREFEKEILHDLYRLTIKLRTSTFKVECLSRFLLPANETVDNDRQIATDLAIIYPPVMREYADQSHDPEFWHKRLMPNVIFEDSKAIQKLQKLARLLGIQTKVYMTYAIPSDVSVMNRLWICVPRIERAMRVAEERKASFKFHTRNGKRWLEWTRGGTTIAVESPLKKYLIEQRAKSDMNGEWSGKLGNIYARDYAILARLPATNQDIARENQSYDYFIGGVRGLGTWGAAWFLDRKFRHFRESNSLGRLEYLLEVHYNNGSITDVLDVSDQSQAYFEEHLLPRTIRQSIRNANQTI